MDYKGAKIMKSGRFPLQPVTSSNLKPGIQINTKIIHYSFNNMIFNTMQYSKG